MDADHDLWMGHAADLHGCVEYRVRSTTSVSRLSHGIAEMSSSHFGDILETQTAARSCGSLN